MNKFALSCFSALDAYRYLRSFNCKFKPEKATTLVKPSETTIKGMMADNILHRKVIDISLFRNCPIKKSEILNLQYLSTAWKNQFVSPANVSPVVFPYDCLLPSPALLIAELSRHLNVYQLSLIALELAGSYTISVDTSDFYSDRYSLLDIKSCEVASKIAKKIHAHGSHKLQTISKILQTGSASPMESLLFASLALPTRLGGSGLNGLKLNHKIAISEDATKIAGQANITVDICHPSSKTAIEYDSRQFHSEVDQSQRDKRRRDALQQDGWTCISVVPQQVNNFEIFKVVQSSITKQIKGRSRIRVKGYSSLQQKCFAELNKASLC